ncbi:unnamed protein product [Sphacelaria rigidula]
MPTGIPGGTCYTCTSRRIYKEWPGIDRENLAGTCRATILVSAPPFCAPLHMWRDVTRTTTIMSGTCVVRCAKELSSSIYGPCFLSIPSSACMPFLLFFIEGVCLFCPFPIPFQCEKR